MWPFSKKPLLTSEENQAVVNAIRDAEKQTSGEIRVFIESRCKYVDAIDRAKEIFANLKMAETEARNGVLFYVALHDRQLAIFADEGIHQAVGSEYWQHTVNNVTALLRQNETVAGICHSILQIGEALKTHFPYDEKVDKNELPDEVIFGK